MESAVVGKPSLTEVARALEVNPNVLHRWRREFRLGPGNVFPGNGKQRWHIGPGSLPSRAAVIRGRP